MNSGTDTIRYTTSSQHQRERQTNTIKQPQKNKWQAELAALSKTGGKNINIFNSIRFYVVLYFLCIFAYQKLNDSLNEFSMVSNRPRLTNLLRPLYRFIAIHELQYKKKMTFSLIFWQKLFSVDQSLENCLTVSAYFIYSLNSRFKNFTKLL